MGGRSRPTERNGARWGWHQLSHEWAERVVSHARIGSGDLVIDIGAGTGAMTAPLVDRGARVIAVELHPGRAAALRRRFGSDVTVVQADASDLRLPRRPFKVVANPPFAITSALLLRLLHTGSRMTTGHVLVQRQTARRWTAPDAPRFNRWDSNYVVGRELTVPRSAFRPRPNVNVVLLGISRRRPATRHVPQRGGRRAPDTPSS